jgi:tRNA threonylcarbamoyladenosine biosynthesis protein TsaE
LDDLDLDLALEDSVVVVEWGDGLAERLASSWLEIRLQRPPLEDGPPESTASPRLVQVLPRGPRWAVVQLHR